MRYFIVCYTATKNNSTIYGQLDVTSRKGYLCLKKLSKLIFDNYSHKTPVVTSIIELNKSDYKDWSK